VPSKLRNADFAKSIEDMAKVYVDALIKFQPIGPFALGGWPSVSTFSDAW
jgi:thioesterase domain-containing protein